MLAAALAVPAHALETDQFYAWTRPLKDATEPFNRKINAEIASVLGRVNARRHPESCRCESVASAIRRHFDYVIIARPELWAMKTSLLDRVPANADEEPRFRRDYLFGATSPLDRVRWMPPSPTVEASGIRFGTDKLGHLLSDGALVEHVYRRALKHGASKDEALRRALRYSIGTEHTIWGQSSSGIFSLGDLEANYQGMMFYRGLCDEADPALTLTERGWRLSRPFDLAVYVTPEWDESWQPNIYGAWRWKKTKPVMLRHCAELSDPEVRRRRADYAARDRETPTEKALFGLVAAGALDDPVQYTIDAVCGDPVRTLTPGVERPGSSR